MFQMLSLLLTFLILYCPEKHLFGVFLVRRTALCTIRTAGELTALKPVFLALPLHGACKMLGSRENAMRKSRVILAPSRLLYIFLVTILEDPASSYFNPCFSNILNILMSPFAVVLRCAEQFTDIRPTTDFVGIQQSTHTTNSRTIKYDERLHARVQILP